MFSMVNYYIVIESGLKSGELCIVLIHICTYVGRKSPKRIMNKSDLISLYCTLVTPTQEMNAQPIGGCPPAAAGGPWPAIAAQRAFNRRGGAPCTTGGDTASKALLCPGGGLLSSGRCWLGVCGERRGGQAMHWRTSTEAPTGCWSAATRHGRSRIQYKKLE